MASAKLIWYSQKVLSDGTSPVMMQVISQRKIARFSIGSDYRCKAGEWQKEAREFSRKFEGYKEKNRVLKMVEARASEILDDLLKSGKPFTFKLFEERFRPMQKANATVFEFFDLLVSEKRTQGKVGNATVYSDMKRVLQKFEPNTKLLFPDIDYRFLKRFESHLLARQCSGGGIHNYMRTLRAVVNEAIRRGHLTRELYPFKNQFNGEGYSLAHLKSTASPRALSAADLEALKNFKAEEHPDLNFAFKIFLFSYYSRGMNFRDIAQLRHREIYNDRINYTRAKTGGTFSIKISDSLRAIMEEFRDPNSEFVFPILSASHQTPSQIKDRVAKKLKQVNDCLKKIGKILGIETPLSTYVARHSFATTLKRNSVDISKISQSLGHADVLTTKAYLKQFEDSEIDELDRYL